MFIFNSEIKIFLCIYELMFKMIKSMFWKCLYSRRDSNQNTDIYNNDDSLANTYVYVYKVCIVFAKRWVFSVIGSFSKEHNPSYM